MRICEPCPAPALHVLMNFMSTHDTVRAITAIAGESCEAVTDTGRARAA